MRLLSNELELTKRQYREPKRVSCRSKGGMRAARPISPLNRRAVVKMNYTAAAKLKKQAAYLAREGAGKDGEAAQLFTADGKEVNLEPLKNEEHIFRVIISPQDGDKLDMEDYTRKVMKQAEKTLGKKLDWIAAVHYNTDNPHAHVIIRGASRGKKLTIDSRFIQQGFRTIAANEATKELGERTEADRERYETRYLRSERFIPLDKELLERARTGAFRRDKQEIGRLEHLANIGVVKRAADGAGFQIPVDLEKQLKIYQYEKNMEEIAAPLRKKYGCQDRVLHYHDSYHVKGEVVAKGLVNEMGDREYAVVRTAKNKLYLVKEPLASKLQTGQKVEIKEGKLEKGQERKN